MPKTKSSDIVVYHRYPLQPQCNQRLPPSSVRGRIAPQCIRPFLYVPWWCSRRIACWRPACSACGWHRRDSRRSSGGWTPSRGGDRRCRRRFRAWPTSCSCLSVVFMPMPLLPSFTFLSCLLSLFLIKKRGGQRPQQIVGRSRRMLLMDTFTVHVHVPVRKKMLHM